MSWGVITEDSICVTGRMKSGTAALAIGRNILEIAYHLLNEQTTYRELGTGAESASLPGKAQRFEDYRAVVGKGAQGKYPYVGGQEGGHGVEHAEK